MPFGNPYIAWCLYCSKRLIRPGDILCAACDYEADQVVKGGGK